MKRVDYDQLERDVTATWSAIDPQGDAVTAGQVRAAEVTGKLTAFLQRELDALKEDDDPRVLCEVLAAITANAAYGLSRQLTDDDGDDEIGQKEAIEMFIQSLVLYLGEMAGLIPDSGLTSAGPAIRVSKTDLGDA